MLPFVKLSANNHDPHRMETQIQPEMLYQFDWSQESRGSETIFISMPSLNDPDCNDTIASAFGESSNPDRIYFGIYEQNSENSGLDCLDFSGVDCPYHPICSRRDHIRITRVDAKEARGPTWGRYNADKHYGGQQFVFVTDSHTFFRTYWDMLVLDLWSNTKNEYAIITHYPKPADSMQRDLERWFNPKGHPLSYHICGSLWEIGPNHMPRNANGCYLSVKKRMELESVVVPFWAAGFSFSKAHVRDNVKWDPHTQYIFNGEEFNFATRAWTHGYDFYSPPFDIAFHRYFAKEKTKRFTINDVHTRGSEQKKDAAEKRINALWGLLELRTPGQNAKADLEEMEIYNLGDKRALSDYWKFAGIDPVEKTFTVFENGVYANGGLQRVPWKDRSIDPVLNPDDVMQMGNVFGGDTGGTGSYEIPQHLIQSPKVSLTPIATQLADYVSDGGSGATPCTPDSLRISGAVRSEVSDVMMAIL